MIKQRNPNLRESYLDGEELFYKYFEMGDAKSIPRLVIFMQKKGIQTTDMGVWKSMWRWASLKENKVAAYRIYKDFGGEASWEQWVDDMKDIIRTAWQHQTDAKYNRFLRDNGWI